MNRQTPADDPEQQDDSPLFANARRADPPTAKVAAASLTSEHLGDLHRKIVAALHEADDGLTTRELAERIGCDRDSISPRMKYLVAHGLARDSGKVRKGASGRFAIVWAAV